MIADDMHIIIAEKLIHFVTYLAQPIRLLLEYLEETYEEHAYDRNEVDAWRNDKFKLGLEFPNVEYPFYVLIIHLSLQVTHPDFMLYDTLDVVLYMDSQCLNELPKLVCFKQCIEDLPQIKNYLNSSRYIKWPLLGWSATFGDGDTPSN
ncbi:uncharacterized protein DC041_0008294 [Schistosoma bovis]|uniref:GST C-terminal domain-containing protein n=1 Tax=Schistosoma bovis TaxID=6184 RepID=A0A430QFI4_SCHBO|nr:uncharacterized protein DC041_0008294 [Schistosoma bovis]